MIGSLKANILSGIKFESLFNQHFQSKFLEFYRIMLTKSIKLDPDLISKLIERNENYIESDQKIPKNYLNLSTFSIKIDFLIL